MYNLIYSLLIGGATTALLYLVYLESFWGGVFPFLLFSVIAYIVLARRSMKELEAIMLRAQEQMKRVQQSAGKKKLVEQQLERAIDILKEGFALEKKQFLVGAQLNAQIGQLYYVQQQFKKSRPYLEKAWPRSWVSIAMKACLQFKNEDYEEMTKTFETAVKYNKKEAMLWSLYAWCLWKAKETDEAIKVLNRGLEVLPNEDRISGNLENLKNKKRMKMRGWREMWYQFHLEAPPKPKMRMDKRSMFRGR